MNGIIGTGRWWQGDGRVPALAVALLLGLMVACGQEAEVPPPSSPELPAAARSDESVPPPAREAPDGPTAAGTAPREETPRIVAFGDSLTAGYGVAADQSYPAQLQRQLDAAGYRYRVINAGVSGDTTAGGLRRVDWVLKARPSIVILELGANDGLRGFDPDQIRENLEQIITKLQAAGVTVVLVGMKLPPNYGVEYTSRFEAIYPALAEQYGLSYMPFFLEGVGAQPALNLPDGIHPTAQGYGIIVRQLMPVLESVLEGRGTG